MAIGLPDENEITLLQRKLSPIDEVPARSFENEKNFHEIVAMDHGRVGIHDGGDCDVTDVAGSEKRVQAKTPHQYRVYFNQGRGRKARIFMISSKP